MKQTTTVHSVVLEALAQLNEASNGWLSNEYDPSDDIVGYQPGEATTIRCDECYLKKAERYIQFTAEVTIEHYDEDASVWIFTIDSIDIITLDDDEYPSINLDFNQLSIPDQNIIKQEIDSQINK